MSTKRARALDTRSSIIPPVRSIAAWLPTLTRATRALQLSALVSLLSALIFAGNAHAATLTITPDKEIYSLGEIITLTVTGTIAPTSESTPNIFVSLEFTYASFISSTADTALNPPPMFGSQTAWAVGGNQGTSIDDEVRVFDQIQGIAGGPFVNNATPDFSSAFITARVMLRAETDGEARFRFSPFTNFFGIAFPSLPDPVFVNIVPEPSSAALMGLGLLSFSIRRRRRAPRNRNAHGQPTTM